MSIKGLLVNTGCTVVRIDKPWATKVWFADLTAIEEVNGQWTTASMSEDWYFSRRVAQEGGNGLIARQSVAAVIEDVGVVVPGLIVAVVNLRHADVALGEAAGD